MTHEEQIKWMSDRIARLETHYESAMKNTATLIGHLGTKRPWVGLTDDEATALWKATHNDDSWELIKRVEAKLKEKNS